MNLDRAEVDRLLALCASEHKWPDPLPHHLEELLRLWLAVDSAPEVWAGVGPRGWVADSGFNGADEVKNVLAGWGSEEERARITASRVRLVPLATAKGEQ